MIVALPHHVEGMGQRPAVTAGLRRCVDARDDAECGRYLPAAWALARGGLGVRLCNTLCDEPPDAMRASSSHVDSARRTTTGRTIDDEAVPDRPRRYPRSKPGDSRHREQLDVA